MGALLITDNTGLRTVPLSSSTLVGRHFHCGCQIYDPAIHLYWLEIRWVGAMWMWRVLSGANRTRGAGAMVHDDWRELKWANGRGGRIVWDELCVVELIDPSPPQLIGRDLRSRRWLDDEELQKWIETVPCLLYTSPSPRDQRGSRMPSSA